MVDSANEPEPQCRYSARTFSYLETKMWNQQASLKNKDAAEVPATGSAAPDRPENERRKTVWFGKSVAFQGELSSAEDMALDGQVEGTIRVRDHSLTIGPDADIRADIEGKIVIIQGRVKGNIVASEKIHLYETAFVEGDVSSPVIVIADGARVECQVETLKQPAEAHA
jgi:cytoskeletal protein CcmA (bactofilin family)